MKEVTNDNVLPVPSIINLPEDNDPVWIMGLNKDGDKVRSVPEVTVKHSLTLTGAVTGSGSLGSPVNTTLSTPIDANNKKITNVESPVGDKDAANKEYVDSNSGGTVTLTGAVTGTGKVGGEIPTVSNTVYDYLVAPVWNTTPWAFINTEVKWERLESEGVSSLSGKLIAQVRDRVSDQSTLFTLQPGHSYELSAWLPLRCDASVSFNPNLEYRWFIWNGSDNKAIGMKGQTTAPAPIAQRPAIAILKIEPEEEVKIVAVMPTNLLEPGIIKIGRNGYCSIRALD